MNNWIDNKTKIIESINNFFNALCRLFQTIRIHWKASVILVILLAISIRIKKIRDFVINKQILSKEVMDFLANNSNNIVFLVLVILCCFLIYTIIKAGNKKIDFTQEQYALINRLHKKLVHKLRNEMYHLYNCELKVKEFKDKNNTEAMQENYGHAYDNMVDTLQFFVDEISEYLSKRNKDIISVCIKTINPGQTNLDNLNKKAKTFVRSNNTYNQRKRKNESITVGLNSDFKHLCDGTNMFYHGIDLKKKYEDGEYINEAEARDWQSKYNSTFVVPIRYFRTYNDITTHDILGFLCIDSKKIVESWDEQEPFELQYLAIFADSIYNYIKLFRRIFEEE